MSFPGVYGETKKLKTYEKKMFRVKIRVPVESRYKSINFGHYNHLDEAVEVAMKVYDVLFKLQPDSLAVLRIFNQNRFQPSFHICKNAKELFKTLLSDYATFLDDEMNVMKCVTEEVRIKIQNLEKMLLESIV